MTKSIRRSVAIAAFLVLSLPSTVMAADAPKVVASINPVHSLAAGVMKGIATPHLLVRGAGSPHSYSLRPSDAEALQSADVVFWTGRGLEAFLAKPIESLARNARIVELAGAEGVTLLDMREGGVWELEAHHAGEHDHDHHGNAHIGKDMHVWLDPANARAMVEAIVATLSEIDAARAATYRANGDRLIARLQTLDGELKAKLAPVRSVPFVVFHDAYQYFGRRYGLEAVGSITLSPERRPSAKRLHEIREKIVALDACCVFSEPQFEPKLIRTVTEGTSARVAQLDPLGASLDPGPDAYFLLMQNMATSLIHCLSHKR